MGNACRCCSRKAKTNSDEDPDTWEERPKDAENNVKKKKKKNKKRRKKYVDNKSVDNEGNGEITTDEKPRGAETIPDGVKDNDLKEISPNHGYLAKNDDDALTTENRQEDKNSVVGHDNTLYKHDEDVLASKEDVEEVKIEEVTVKTSPSPNSFVNQVFVPDEEFSSSLPHKEEENCEEVEEDEGIPESESQLANTQVAESLTDVSNLVSKEVAPVLMNKMKAGSEYSDDVTDISSNYSDDDDVSLKSGSVSIATTSTEKFGDCQNNISTENWKPNVKPNLEDFKRKPVIQEYLEVSDMGTQMDVNECYATHLMEPEKKKSRSKLKSKSGARNRLKRKIKRTLSYKKPSNHCETLALKSENTFELPTELAKSNNNLQMKFVTKGLKVPVYIDLDSDDTTVKKDVAIEEDEGIEASEFNDVRFRVLFE